MNFEIHNEEIDHKLEAYDYILDETLIANKPSKVRHESRLMIVRDSSLEEDFTTNKYTKNLLDELKKGDLVVVNDTKVMKARLKVELENGRLVELLVLEKSYESTWLCLAKPAKKLKIDKQLKRLYPKYLGFKDCEIVDFIGGILDKKLSYTPQGKNFNHWIFVRLSLVSLII